MKNQSLIIVGAVVLILISIFVFYFVANKKIDSQNSNNQQEPIVDVIELCEIENPRFNPTEECQKVIDEKYSNKECTFEFGPTQWLPFGSCRNCTITCK